MKILQHIRAFVSGMMGVSRGYEEWSRETEEFLNELFPQTKESEEIMDKLIQASKPQPAKRKRTRRAVKK